MGSVCFPFFSAAALVAITIIPRSVAVWRCGRAKLTYRERHMPEHRAGIVLAGLHALLVGHAVFGGMDQILRGTHDSYDREDAERHREISAVRIVERAVDTGGNALGNIAAAATQAAAGVVRLTYATVQDHGIDDLDDRDRQILGRAAGLGDRAIIRRVGIALEDADVALTAIQNHLLFKHGNALKFLTASAAQTRLELDLDVKADRDRIKDSVKANGINTDIGPSNARILYANVCCTLQNFIPEIRKQYFNVFETIPISARIQNTIGFNTDHFRAS